MAKEKGVDPLTQAFIDGEKFRRAAVAEMEGMTLEQRNAYCTQMDAWRAAVADG